MTDPRSTVTEGVYAVRLVESPVETSALDRRHDDVPVPKPRVIVMRPTTNTQFIVTSAIDLRDDVLRDEVPSIVGDACHGVLGAERDAIVQAIEQEDTRPMRRLATGTTPPAVNEDVSQKTRHGEREDTEDISGPSRTIIEHARRVGSSDVHQGSRSSAPAFLQGSEAAGADAGEDSLTRALARGSSPSLDRAVAFARGSYPSLDDAAAHACGSSIDENTARGKGGAR